MATLTISLTKITSEVKFAERKSPLLLNNNVWKSLLFRLSCLVPRPHFSSQPKRFGSSGPCENVRKCFPPVRLEYVTETNWPRATGKTPYRDWATVFQGNPAVASPKEQLYEQKTSKPIFQGNPAVASPKEQLYEQKTSNPAFTERNIQ